MPDRREGSVAEPIRCQITVQGHIAAGSWSCGERLRSRRGERDGLPTTTVSGRFKDEDEVLAVLTTLHEMHLSILDVR